MLYAVILKYVRPIEEVRAHLDTHRDWLVEHTKKGRILVAGPLDDNSGGAIISHCKDRAELDEMLASDSFTVHRLVDHEIRGFTGAMRAEAFSSTWAPEAKPV
ncbi:MULTISPECIES: YciI family protein [unclassified Bradyrhizobium]|uniref:YciI family protein n=1 Tax=unclassified Bradyrhizobium TaxID=2631580 RepID=UPI0024E100DA|nr:MULTISPECIES: YciI family protein [unclassified Bradyrhizobium]